MLDQLGWGEFGVLLVLGLFVFGPDRLPSLAADVGRALHRARRLLRELTSDITDDIGPELGELARYAHDPKGAIRRHLLDDSEALQDGEMLSR